MFTQNSVSSSSSRKVTPQSGNCKPAKEATVAPAKVEEKPNEESNNIISLLDEEEEKQIKEATKRSIRDFFFARSSNSQ